MSSYTISDVDCSVGRNKDKKSSSVDTIYTMNFNVPTKDFPYGPQEILTVAPKKKPSEKEPHFQVKIRFLDQWKKNMEIYFMSPITARIKSMLELICSTYEDTFTSDDFEAIEAGKWKYMTKFYLNKLTNYTISRSLCDIEFYFTFTVQHKSEKKQHRNDNQLLNVLKNLHDNDDFADVILKSIDGVELKAHKVILAARSPVFKAHFMHSTVESETNVVTCSFEAAILKEILSYIYTNQTPNIDDIADKLFMAADFYQLDDLKALCEDALCIKLTVDNALYFFQLSAKYNASNLKETILGFVKSEIKLLISTEKWRELFSDLLVSEIIKQLVNVAENKEAVFENLQNTQINTQNERNS